MPLQYTKGLDHKPKMVRFIMSASTQIWSSLTFKNIFQVTWQRIWVHKALQAEQSHAYISGTPCCCLNRERLPTIQTGQNEASIVSNAGWYFSFCSWYVVLFIYACIYGGPKVSRQFQFAHGNFNLLTTVSICSRQFQFAHGSFNFAHGNFDLPTAVSICSRQFQFRSRQFQFAHGSFNFAHGNFDLPTAVSICSRQFQFRLW